jgi:hypothetical protein
LTPPATAAGLSLWKEIRAYEQKAVISQKKNMNSRLPDRTSPAMAPMKNRTSA